MSKLVIAAAASAAALSGLAHAQDSGVGYLEVGLGVAFPVQDDLTQEGVFEVGTEFEEAFSSDGSVDLGTGASFHLLAGYEVTPRIAIEVEGQANAHEIDGSGTGFAVGAWTVNAVYTGDKSASFVPYAGVGLGYADPSFFDDDGDEIDSDVDGALAYQVKAGVMKPVGVHHNFAAELRYLGAGDFESEIDDGFTQLEEAISYGGLSVSLNYRFRFGSRP